MEELGPGSRALDTDSYNDRLQLGISIVDLIHSLNYIIDT